MSRRVISLFLFLAVGLLMVCGSATAATPTVLLDGKPMDFKVSPMIENGNTLVPFRDIFEGLGAIVGWDQSTGTISATKDSTVVKLHMGDTRASKNGTEINMGVAPKIVNDYTLVPLRFVSEALGARVGWYESSCLITISRSDAVGKGKKVALTFDDGPDSIYTGQVLDVLKNYHALGTFFLIGENMERYPEVVKRIHAEGHEMGNHSYNHPNFKDLSKEMVLSAQIERTRALFKSMAGVEPTIYRPPYTSITKDQLEYLNVKGYTQVRWRVNTEDYDPLVNTPANIVARSLIYGKNGGIIIMHTANGDRSNTVKALPVIIEEFRQMGVELCTVSQMPLESYNSQHYNDM